jgi:hypothetical protein
MFIRGASRISHGDHYWAQGYERQKPGGKEMLCERCGGLMVIETICDLMKEEFRRGSDTTRCLNCGNFEDTIIRTNRGIFRLPRQVEPRTGGTRRRSAIQPSPLERSIPEDDVISESPRGRPPRLSVEDPSGQTRTFKPVRIKLNTPRSLRGSPLPQRGLRN